MWLNRRDNDWDGYYTEEIPVAKAGPRIMRFTEDFEIFSTKIPKDYEVDGATVPRILWFVLSPFTEGFEASVVHDKRHRIGMTWKERKHADDEYHRNLLRCLHGVQRTGDPGYVLRMSWSVRCFLAWVGVRSYAWITWRKWRHA